MRVALYPLFLMVLPGMALAQSAPGARPTPKPTSLQAIESFAVRQPDEGSPFFSNQQEAQAALSRTVAVDRGDVVAEYPKVKNSPDSATAMLSRFFTDMFSSVHFGPINRGPANEKLDIDPAKFSLQDRREVEAVYTVRNNTGKLVRLEFPTTQRIDILTKSPSGSVIERWSDDRAFVPKEGLVIINPKERLEYSEKVPTRDMKPNETYSIEAQTVGYPQYNTTKTVTPSP